MALENSTVNIDTVLFKANHASTLIALDSSTLDLTDLKMVLHTGNSFQGLVSLTLSQFSIQRVNASFNDLPNGSIFWFNASKGAIEDSWFDDNVGSEGATIKQFRSSLTISESHVRIHGE